MQKSLLRLVAEALVAFFLCVSAWSFYQTSMSLKQIGEAHQRREAEDAEQQRQLENTRRAIIRQHATMLKQVEALNEKRTAKD